MIPDRLALLAAFVGALGVAFMLAYALVLAGDAAVRRIRTLRLALGAAAGESVTPAEPLAVHQPPPVAGTR